MSTITTTCPNYFSPRVRARARENAGLVDDLLAAGHTPGDAQRLAERIIGGFVLPGLAHVPVRLKGSPTAARGFQRTTGTTGLYDYVSFHCRSKPLMFDPPYAAAMAGDPPIAAPGVD